MFEIVIRVVDVEVRLAEVEVRMFEIVILVAEVGWLEDCINTDENLGVSASNLE